MFSKTKKKDIVARPVAGKKSPPSIISSDLNILGNLLSDGILDIDGRIEGNVKAQSITIRHNAKIKGDVHAETLHVYGEIKGMIKAKTVHFYSSCHVEGIIMHESLSIEDGAFVDGKFKRTDKVFVEEETLDFDDDEDNSDVKVLEHIRLISGGEGGRI